MANSLILGFFDGVHVAHQAVIKSALNENSILVTFKESPSLYFQGHVEYILSRKNSLEKIKSLGVKEIVEYDFAEVAQMTADEYLQMLVHKFSPVSVSTGYNHTFGKGRNGNSELLYLCQNKYNYKYCCIPAQKDGEDVISSTLIKELLQKGNIERANTLLKSNFILEGQVISGMHLATKLGFPTANFVYPPNIIKIPYGVYKVSVFGMPALLNWGNKPTIGENLAPILEVYIPDFSADLYGKDLTLQVIKKIRDEKRFESTDELRVQIEKDVIECLK